MARWAVHSGGRHGSGSTERQRQAADCDDELAEVLRRHAKSVDREASRKLKGFRLRRWSGEVPG
jgi:hypothetical protein